MAIQMLLDLDVEFHKKTFIKYLWSDDERNSCDSMLRRPYRLKWKYVFSTCLKLICFHAGNFTASLPYN